MRGSINAAAVLRNWAINLNGALAGPGARAAHAAFNLLIDSGPEKAAAAAIAPLFSAVYQKRDAAEYVYAPHAD